MSEKLLPVVDDDAGRQRPFEVEDAVRQRYSAASNRAEASLCCAVQYDDRFLQVLPPELIERDYGCGDPSRHLKEGDHVLDLGCGGGKICYIASQIVGRSGRVIGVDMNADMLSLARKYQSAIAQRIGWNNVTFYRGRIQDLALDLDQFEELLRQHPIQSTDDWLAAQSWANAQRRSSPMVADGSVDVVISNCVLNLVRPEDRRDLFAEIYRVLRNGGRAAISDIVCDRPVPPPLKHDAKLWSGCISGAFMEHELLDAFLSVGFHGLTILDFQQQPWSVVEGIEFRSMTVCAYKGACSSSIREPQAVMYNGPWSAVIDDMGNRLERGKRLQISGKGLEMLGQPPYTDECSLLAPSTERSGCCGKTDCC